MPCSPRTPIVEPCHGRRTAVDRRRPRGQDFCPGRSRTYLLSDASSLCATSPFPGACVQCIEPLAPRTIVLLSEMTDSSEQADRYLPSRVGARHTPSAGLAAHLSHSSRCRMCLPSTLRGRIMTPVIGTTNLIQGDHQVDSRQLAGEKGQAVALLTPICRSISPCSLPDRHCELGAQPNTAWYFYFFFFLVANGPSSDILPLSRHAQESE